MQLHTAATAVCICTSGAVLCMGGLLLTVAAVRTPGHGSHRPAAYVLPRPGAAPSRRACPWKFLGKTNKPPAGASSQGFVMRWASVARSCGRRPPFLGTTVFGFAGVKSARCLLQHRHNTTPRRSLSSRFLIFDAIPLFKILFPRFRTGPGVSPQPGKGNRPPPGARSAAEGERRATPAEPGPQSFKGGRA